MKLRGVSPNMRKPVDQQKVVLPLILPQPGDDLSFSACFRAVLTGGVTADKVFAIPAKRAVVVDHIHVQPLDFFAAENLTANFLLDGVIYRPRDQLQTVAVPAAFFETLLPQRFVIDNPNKTALAWGLRLVNGTTFGTIFVDVCIGGWLTALRGVGGDVT